MLRLLLLPKFKRKVFINIVAIVISIVYPRSTHSIPIIALISTIVFTSSIVVISLAVELTLETFRLILSSLAMHSPPLYSSIVIIILISRKLMPPIFLTSSVSLVRSPLISSFISPSIRKRISLSNPKLHLPFSLNFQYRLLIRFRSVEFIEKIAN